MLYWYGVAKSDKHSSLLELRSIKKIIRHPPEINYGKRNVVTISISNFQSSKNLIQNQELLIKLASSIRSLVIQRIVFGLVMQH
jgi:hypothetical protein